MVRLRTPSCLRRVLVGGGRAAWRALRRDVPHSSSAAGGGSRGLFG